MMRRYKLLLSILSFFSSEPAVRTGGLLFGAAIRTARYSSIHVGPRYLVIGDGWIAVAIAAVAGLHGAALIFVGVHYVENRALAPSLQKAPIFFPADLCGYFFDALTEAIDARLIVFRFFVQLAVFDRVAHLIMLPIFQPRGVSHSAKKPLVINVAV